MRGSLTAKLPPVLTISSSNLRVLDPIGQGMSARLMKNNENVHVFVVILGQVNLG